MKIGIFSEVVVYNPPFPSGVARFFREIAEALVQRGHEVYIIEPLKDRNQPRTQCIKDKITLYHPFSINFKKYLNTTVCVPLPEIFRGLPSELDDLDVVHANSPGIAVLALMTSYRKKIPRIISYHTPLIQYTSYAPLPFFFLRNRRVVNVLERLVYNQFHITVVPTQGVKNELVRRGFKGPWGFFPTCLNLQELPVFNSQDLDVFRQRFNLFNKKIILFVGRMSPEKNIEEVLQIIPAIIKQEPLAHFLMVGTGPFLEQYKQLIQAQNLSAHVTFTGYLSDRDLFTAINIAEMGLIFAKEAQIMDMTILEYWNYGLPLIIRNAMGITEIVHENTNGFLFSSLKEAVNKILYLLKHENLIAEIKSNNMSIVRQKYDIRKCIIQLESLYDLNYPRSQ